MIGLAQIGRLELLRELHTQVFIPTEVAREIQPTVPVLPVWLAVRAPTVGASIGAGERQVINLGLELDAGRLIMDEQPARKLAVSLGLRVIGTVEILLAAKERGILTQVKPELDRLLAVRFFMDQQLYERALQQAGEPVAK